MTRHTAPILLALVLFSLWQPAAATAQDLPPEQIEAARARFERAVSLYERENFALALEEFEAAYGMMEGHPNRGMMLYNIARCMDRLERYGEAIDTYARFLVEAPDTSPDRDAARDRMEELDRRRARGELVEGEPEEQLATTGEDVTPPTPETRSEGSFVNWLIAGGLVAAAVPLIAIPMWTVATEGECVAIDMAGCLERVQFGAQDGVLLGVGAAALIAGVVFAAAQPIQVEVQASREGAYLGVHGSF
jgi:hypothetical protein